MSRCSSNPCELRETQKPHVHVFGFDPVSNPVAPVLGNRWHLKMAAGRVSTQNPWVLYLLGSGSGALYAPGFAVRGPETGRGGCGF
jgi:hypothetical protein